MNELRPVIRIHIWLHINYKLPQLDDEGAKLRSFFQLEHT